MDIGGYYSPDLERASQAMRPSATFNAAIATLS
jgi:isocitrate dehydrogenase